jgi:hypothetical protein
VARVHDKFVKSGSDFNQFQYLSTIVKSIKWCGKGIISGVAVLNLGPPARP